MFKQKLCTLFLAISLSTGLNACCSNYSEATKTTRPNVITPDVAQELLSKGNDFYLSNNNDSSLRNDLTVHGQHPYAVVITCSDSRDVPEIAFNANFGDIFTIRTAGNVVSNFEVGSVEYGAEHLGSPLVVVLGHTNCGAVTAACEAHEGGEVNHINDIINEIQPSVSKARANGSTDETLLNDAIVLNVENSINRLRESETLSKLEKEGKIKIVGAIYNITSGKVTFLNK
ncbi:MAG: carbonic anhydrase [Succinivibrionaceae bacterium]